MAGSEEAAGAFDDVGAWRRLLAALSFVGLNDRRVGDATSGEASLSLWVHGRARSHRRWHGLR